MLRYGHILLIQDRSNLDYLIAGNGGSPLEGSVSSVEHFYGFTRIILTKGGRVIEESYGRDIPVEGYLAPCPASAYPTTIRDTFELTRPR